MTQRRISNHNTENETDRQKILQQAIYNAIVTPSGQIALLPNLGSNFLKELTSKTTPEQIRNIVFLATKRIEQIAKVKKISVSRIGEKSTIVIEYIDNNGDRRSVTI